MKIFLILLLAINACHCQIRCNNEDDIKKISATPSGGEGLEYYVKAIQEQNNILNQTVSNDKPDGYPRNSIAVRCSCANLGRNLDCADPYIDEKWESTEELDRQVDDLEKTMEENANRRVKRGFGSWFKKACQKVANVVKKIAQIVQTVQTVIKVVKTVVTIIGIFAFFFG